jgi:hypothetical protein
VPIALEDSLHGFHRHVTPRAQKLRNVTLACREFGVACSLFCCWRKHKLACQPDGPHPRSQDQERRLILNCEQWMTPAKVGGGRSPGQAAETAMVPRRLPVY